MFDRCRICLKKLKLMFVLIFTFSSSATGVKFDLEFVHVFTQTKKKLTFSFNSAWYLFRTHPPLNPEILLGGTETCNQNKFLCLEQFVFAQGICV